MCRTVDGESDPDVEAKQWAVLYYRDSFDGKPPDDVVSLLSVSDHAVWELVRMLARLMYFIQLNNVY